MENYDIIIIGGQSNAQGYGLGAVTKEYLPDERILIMNDEINACFEKDERGIDVLKINYPSPKRITVADERMENGEKIGNLALTFAARYVADGRLGEGRRLLILNTGVGGTGFRDDQWGIGRTLYERMKDFCHTALKLGGENRLVAFLWHQGECDSIENPEWDSEFRFLTHRKNLAGMLSDFKTEFSVPTLPVIMGGFCDEWYLEHKAVCDAVIGAMREVCAEQGGGFVETAGLKSNHEAGVNEDVIHFSRESLHILGERYYEKYKASIK